MTHFTTTNPWPNAVDLLGLGIFLAVALLLPAIGYLFMVRDFRAYLRSFQRGIVRIGQCFRQIPDWARHETPCAIAALGLRFPCTEDDLKRAYRRRVKRLHPDHGGDQRRFMVLQAQFEEALEFLASRPLDRSRWTSRQSAA